MVNPKTPKRRPVAVSTGKSAIKTAKNAKKKFPKVKRGSVTCVPGDGGFGKWSDYDTLYHGSHEIVSDIDLNRSSHGKKNSRGVLEFKDFGKGFYTTSSKKQADEYATSSVKRYNEREKKHRTRGYVSVFAFSTQDAKENLRILVFNGVSKEWLDFITDHHDPSFDHQYDVVIGPVAEDSAANIIEEYRSLREKGRTVDWRIAVKRLKPHLLKDQILFHTERSKKYLKYVKALVISWND